MNVILPSIGKEVPLTQHNMFSSNSTTPYTAFQMPHNDTFVPSYRAGTWLPTKPFIVSPPPI